MEGQVSSELKGQIKCLLCLLTNLLQWGDHPQVLCSPGYLEESNGEKVGYMGVVVKESVPLPCHSSEWHWQHCFKGLFTK